MPTKQTRLDALARHILRVGRQLEDRQRRSDRLSTIRLLLVVVGGPALWFAFFLAGNGPGALLTAVWVVIFAAVVRVHRRIKASIQAHEVWLRIKRMQIARIHLDWEHLPRPRKDPPPDGHPFALDLDLVGERSLHRLLDTAITREGSRRLMDWLLDTRPDPAIIQRRQALVRELTPLTRFRDKLTLTAALASSDGGAPWEGRRLLGWLADRIPPAALRPWLIVLIALAALNIVLFGLHTWGVLPPIWGITLLIYAAVYLSRRQAFESLFEETLTFVAALRKLDAALGYLERYPYGQHPGLRDLCAPLTEAGDRPSAALRQINLVASAASIQGNPFLWLPINAIVPWDMIFATRLNHLKAAVEKRLPAWLDVWFELEALNGLANFAYLNPDYTLPTLSPEAEGFSGRGLGHPLIPYPEKISNDFSLEQGEIAIITGSNMSGKSSFLRTVGVNLRLAYAGGPVDAAALDVPLFRLFTAIHVTDSVTDGISYFYAEVKRLKALLEALEQTDGPPLFFLIDEIFRGTNNRERLVGSRAYIRALAGGGGTGLLATHDLELVHLENDIPQIANYHFKETVAEGRMLFDYRLRPGPCPTTNALVIMRMEGLPVEAEG